MQLQLQMALPQVKLFQKAKEHWNSILVMLKHVLELREPLGAAFSSLPTDIIQQILLQKITLAQKSAIPFFLIIIM